MDCTASFLPKPVTGVNGNGMHTNMSLAKGGKNLFFDAKGKEGLSKAGWDFIDRILTSADELCLVLNSSVNAYRRLDPHFEAPNQIKASPTDRGSMVRIPIGNSKTTRIEVRSIGPDANPYLALYCLLRTGLEGPVTQDDEGKRPRTRFLPDNISDAIRLYKSGKFLSSVLGEDLHGKFAELKSLQAERCPRILGSIVKNGEVQFHHEVTNQYLWSQF
jgi:glutamine synthetase